jgi:hypothetical protein
LREYALELLGEILRGIVVIPALLPEVLATSICCRARGWLGFFLGPVCALLGQCLSVSCGKVLRCGTFNGEVFELVIFLQHLGLLLLGLL